MFLCLLIGGAAGRVTFQSVGSWYASLARPPFSPPNWVFGPVWGMLYIMMAVAAWLVWRHRHGQTALTLWGAQLAVNALWTPVFFGLHRLAGGLGVIAALFAVLAWTTVAFWRLDRLAGALLLPYLAWVGFAGYLNAGFWWLNR